MPTVRVKEGLSYGAGGKYPAGTVLEVTEAEVEAFGDKLEPVVEATRVIIATDAAANLAEKRGIDLTQVEGTGSGSKITLTDVKNHIRAGADVEAPAADEGDEPETE